MTNKIEFADHWQVCHEVGLWVIKAIRCEQASPHVLNRVKDRNSIQLDPSYLKTNIHKYILSTAPFFRDFSCGYICKAILNLWIICIFFYILIITLWSSKTWKWLDKILKYLAPYFISTCMSLYFNQPTFFGVWLEFNLVFLLPGHQWLWLAKEDWAGVPGLGHLYWLWAQDHFYQ